ncbi:MAG: cation transporter [Candidatus Margulisiibacteriota bacterium]|nr:cation transporter [Candidatus Margulisiibacteriota bacterium]
MDKFTAELNLTPFKALLKASFIAIAVDIFLIALKYSLAGITGSTMLLADALHSGGDLGISLTVLVSILVKYLFANNEKARQAEGVVALLVSFLLLLSSFWLFSDVLGNEPAGFVLSSDLSLVIAFLGISLALGVILVICRFKRRVGEKYHSIAFIAEGMHSHSDFFTSFGVWCTLLLGYFGVHIERITTLVVAVAVFCIGGRLLYEALRFFDLDYTTIVRGNSLIPDVIRFFKKNNSMMIKILLFPEGLILKHKGLVVFLNICLVAGLYVGTGFYQVLPCQTGVEMLFGKVMEMNPPGLHFHAPKPFGNVILVDTGAANRVENGFRTDWDYKDEEPEAYLWEFTHTQGRYPKVPDEAIAITGDENLIDGNFLCYYSIRDPVQYVLNTKNAHEILRSLFCYEVHATLGHYELDRLLTSDREKVQAELCRKMVKAVEKLPIGVEIVKVYMQEVHPPIEVVPQYRAVASTREKKNEIIHKASAYFNDLLPRSRGKAQALLLEADIYTAEKNHAAQGRAKSFLLKQRHFLPYKAVHQARMWWETVQEAMENKPIYILPGDAERRIYLTGNKQEEEKE